MAEPLTNWTEAHGVSQQDRGQDHLGLISVAQNIYDQVTPGFTTQTNRARYYAFYCWIFHDYFSGGYQEEAFEPFFRRREYAFALACASHDHDPSSQGAYAAIGANTATPRWRSEEDPLDLTVRHLKNSWGGLNYYQYAMQRVGLMAYSDDQYNLTESETDAPSGRALAEAFQSAIEDTQYFREYRDAYHVPRSVIEEYGQAACLCQMSDAPDGAVLRRALLQPEPQASDGAVRALHLARSRTLALIFHAMNHCEDERMDDMAWRQLMFYRAFSDGRSYEPPESLAEPAFIWRLYQQREFHVYALTSMWADLLWWLEDHGPATLEERVAALDTEMDLRRTGERFGLKPSRRRPSEVSVHELLDSVAAVGVGGGFHVDVTEGIEGGIGRNAVCSEKRLQAALSTDESLETGDYVGAALLLSLVLYARTLHWGSMGGTAAHITRMGDTRQWSVASYFAEIARRSDGTALDLLAWIYRNLARQHLMVAMSKLHQLDTFRLLYEDGLLHYRAPDYPYFTSDRYDRILAISRDLGWVRDSGGAIGLTPLGERDRAQAMGVLA